MAGQGSSSVCNTTVSAQCLANQADGSWIEEIISGNLTVLTSLDIDYVCRYIFMHVYLLNTLMSSEYFLVTIHIMYFLSYIVLHYFCLFVTPLPLKKMGLHGVCLAWLERTEYIKQNYFIYLLHFALISPLSITWWF